VKTFDEVIQDPQLNSRDYFREVHHPQAGDYRYPGPPYRLSQSPCKIVRPAPALGQHNQEILGGKLRLDSNEMEELARTGVI
jgi:formyl-CoA transferase